ncbi:helix-turn-helix domain-containing protein [Enterococcus faecalis]|nr:helix-turn-helix domain-containing protein [Enterococcus faecalis]EHB5067227.1 helix-turn-helix domain-containing protein [Enterococcus faecalis]EHS8400575.1 helix-turn-helix domain-containing protein [Enterococcus faecalis]EHZ2968069.1 helix-turn-helix domain-containing protein [Enterococcus faecalis]EIR4022182.1 helix-turn-helix domain-containing protein [Enterococcus faecalis]
MVFVRYSEQQRGVKKLSNSVREFRVSKGITQTKLAKMANISRPYLAEIEKGDSNPSAQIAISIAKSLGTTVETIFLPKTSYMNYKKNKNVRKQKND